MKKFICFLLILSFAIAFASCDGVKVQSEGTELPSITNAPEETEEKIETSKPIDDATATETNGEETDITENATTATAEDGTTESTDVATTEGTKIENTEETKAETTDDPKEEITEEPKADTTEEPKAETTEEPKAETTEEPKTETTEEPKAETTEEPKAETTEEPKAETTEEPKEEITEEPVTTVEKSEWEKLFSTDNFAMYYESEMIREHFRFDGDTLYFYLEYDGQGATEYIERVETGEYWITEEVYFRGNWLKGLDEYGLGGKMFAVREDYFYSLSDDYDAFTYDEESKTYVADTLVIYNSGFEYTVTDVSVQVENGKLIQVKFFWDTYTILINEVGAVEVEMPTVDFTVTEDEWNAIWTGDDFNNVEVRVIEEYGSIVDRLVVESHITAEIIITEDAIRYNYNMFIVKEDGVWYVLENRDDGYYGVEQTNEDVEKNFSINGAFGVMFANNFNSFTYDEENKCYVGVLEKEEYRIYFANGRIAFVELVRSDGSKVAYWFRGYGDITQDELDIPEYTIENNENGEEER